MGGDIAAADYIFVSVQSVGERLSQEIYRNQDISMMKLNWERETGRYYQAAAGTRLCSQLPDGLSFMAQTNNLKNYRTQAELRREKRCISQSLASLLPIADYRQKEGMYTDLWP